MVTDSWLGVHEFGIIDPDEPTNISTLLAFECTQGAVQSVCVNDTAPLNILSIFCVFDTSQADRSLLNDDAAQNKHLISRIRDTSHFDRSAFNEVAPSNIELIFLILDTFHLEMSLLNATDL